MKLAFSKMSGAGNDFVLVEETALRGRAADAGRLARLLCDRRRGVGADGLLVLARRSELVLRYFNADGSAAFCGNGTRCAAWWAHDRGWTSGRRGFSLSTSEGPLAVRIAGPGRAAVRMPEPKRARLGLKLKVRGRALTVHALDTGVPHAVVFVPDAEAVDVEGLGRALRRHKAFGRAGANADFVQAAPSRLVVRTYERGVEAETLACGTGVVAAALAASLLGKARSPVRVRTRGGDELTVTFTARGDAGRVRFSEVWLEGPAAVAFNGEIEL